MSETITEFSGKQPEVDGEEVIVAGPICPVCNKAFATKNVRNKL